MEIEEIYSPITEEVKETGRITHEKEGESKITQEEIIVASIMEKVEVTSIIV